MYLVLADTNDCSAVWGFHQLVALRQRVEFVTPGELVVASCWNHRVGGNPVDSSVTLRRGLTVVSSEVKGVLNRVSHLPQFLFRHLRESDRAYASQEVTALYFSWLHAMRAPVLNRPTGMGLAGTWRHDSEWAALAAESGLDARPFRQCSREAKGVNGPKLLRRMPRKVVIVIGRAVLGSCVPREVATGALELARRARTPILGVEFEDHGAANPWVFVSASPRPDLQGAGHAAIRALLAAWKEDAA